MSVKRIYTVTFELFEDGRWTRNFVQRSVCVEGGAEQAIKVATGRVKKDYANVGRCRATSAALVAEED